MVAGTVDDIVAAWTADGPSLRARLRDESRWSSRQPAQQFEMELVHDSAAGRLFRGNDPRLATWAFVFTTKPDLGDPRPSFAVLTSIVIAMVRPAMLDLHTPQWHMHRPSVGTVLDATLGSVRWVRFAKRTYDLAEPDDAHDFIATMLRLRSGA